jgi:hypothetical protein
MRPFGTQASSQYTGRFRCPGARHVNSAARLRPARRSGPGALLRGHEGLRNGVRLGVGQGLIQLVERVDPRPDVAELLSSGIDPQLELAVLILKAKALKELESAAQASAVKQEGAAPKEG